jgi:hypothetical protein
MPTLAGKLRPSQAVTQHGPGALIDLPTLSMIVMAADGWEPGRSRRVDEPRLARRLHVASFRNPPYYDRKTGTGGIPATVFPTFLVCPRCNCLARHTSFSFDARRSEYKCKAPNCRGKGQSTAYPARFMVACAKGHLADFPWHAYVHGPHVACDAELRLEDSGRTGSITDLWVKCPTHKASKNLGQAFGQGARWLLPACGAERPWVGDIDPAGCTEQTRVLLRGASNAYFPIVESALSIPPWSDPIQVALGAYVDQMGKVDSLEKTRAWLDVNTVPELERFTADQVWSALDRRREGAQETDLDLRQEEWRALQAEPGSIDAKAEFHSRAVAVAPEAEEYVGRVVLLERLREVRALRGFTRIDPIPDVGDLGEVEALNSGMAPIMSHGPPEWYPGVDFRGEGVFLQLREDRVAEWEARPAVREMAERHVEAQRRWSEARGLEFGDPRPPRYLLLHSLAHAVIRQLSLDCGYSSTSLRERIYSSDDPAMPMAGILVYTATSDSDGSLGGLVEMGKPEDLGPLTRRALQEAEFCAGDPFCASQEPAGSAQLNGAACHACLLIAETACEAGNRHLDRATLVPSLRESRTAFITL